MKNNTLRLGAAIFGIILTTALVAGATYAFGGHGKIGPKNEAVKAAIEAGDYNAWAKALDEHSRWAGIINEDNFGKMVEIHELVQAGNYEGATALKEELGFKTGWHGKRFNNKQYNVEKREIFRAAIEAGDYSLLGEDPKLSEEKFARIVECHEENGGFAEFKKGMRFHKYAK